MARLQEVEPLYTYTQEWKERCLLQDMSILWPEEPIWTLDNLRALKTAFIDQPDESQRNFQEKLYDQLREQPSAVYKLIIEIHCLYDLFPRNRNLQNIEKIASWGGIEVPRKKWLTEVLQLGIGNTGTYFNTNKPHEIRFLILFAMGFKQVSDLNERREILSNPKRLAQFINTVMEEGAVDSAWSNKKASMNNILKHLLLPEHFERIASFGAKEAIVKHFTGVISEAPDPVRVDEQIAVIRQKLLEQYPGKPVDFYREPWNAWEKKQPRESSRKKPIESLDDVPETLPSDQMARLSFETGYPKEQLLYWLKQINRKKQAIFQGPPGTGKTFIAKLLASVIAGENGLIEQVQFHPNYSYDEFLQGLRPTMNAQEQLIFQRQDGIFKTFCEQAEAVGTDTPCVFLIDEINRANLSSVFGELMYLLEYRDESIQLPSGDRFKIPDNVYIIGTMNTADRSIALMDNALRRRFRFLFLEPSTEVLSYHLEETGIHVDGLISVLNEINAKIGDRHYALGISYFLSNKHDLETDIQDIWECEIEPYLEEYFNDQPGHVREFRWQNVDERILFAGV
jgi:hypothetical protein